ncbi:aspartate carbamoyltransferase catalytic subunit [Tropicimonas sp.]|uniref:aspartate carbamoyltransferase catalytic subunit n=1 Tax=Tropicimonas sp. TaxID=2067044 RepID=UPI003A86D5A0
MSEHSGWEGILQPGETVLWQGRPSGRVSFRHASPRRMVAGGFMTAFAVFWTISAAGAAGGATDLIGRIFPLFGLIFVFLGLREAGGWEVWRAFVRRHSWYSLTSRRAFIATEIFGRRALRSWPIDRETVLDFEEGPPDTIWFADRPGRRGRPRTRTTERVGFELIDDGREVLRLMRNIQRGAA